MECKRRTLVALKDAFQDTIQRYGMKLGTVFPRNQGVFNNRQSF
jgi:hypothetical protein